MRGGRWIRAVTAGVAVSALLGPAATPGHAFVHQDFMLSAAPGAVSLTPGASGMVGVTVTAIGGFTGPVTVAAAPTASLLIAPSEFTLAAGETQAVTITADPNAGPATMSLVFTGVSPSIAGSRTATVAVTIEPEPPPPPPPRHRKSARSALARRSLPASRREP